MVALSFHRGNLHRVPDLPRRWLMPTHRVPFKDFPILLQKRAKALSRLHSSTTTTTTTTPSAGAITPNPNPNPNFEQKGEEGVGDNGCSKQIRTIEIPQPQSKPTAANDLQEEPSQQQQHRTNGDAKDQSRENGDLCTEQQREIDGFVLSPGTKSTGLKNGCGLKGGSGTSRALEEEEEEKPVFTTGLAIEISNIVDIPSAKAKRKRELEDKLHILNEKKHGLVQQLKQILNAEEEMKKRSSMQVSVIRPSAPLQVDATIDTGSITRHAIPRMGSEANFGGDLEGEADDVSNHYTHARNLHRMRSTSPSAASPLRRPAYAAPFTTRASLVGVGPAQTTSGSLMGVAASPSRFAPTGHQGHPANLPPASLSGTHYIASSPSPAASGGTSVFRDARLTSPSWS